MLSSKEKLIRDLPLEYIEKRLVDKERWSLEEAKEAVRRYKNFLILLYKYPDLTLAPAPDIDEAWHTHILFTEKYMADCEAIFGHYLHHAPASPDLPDEKRLIEDAQSRTVELYVKEFNEPFFLELNVSSFW